MKAISQMSIRELSEMLKTEPSGEFLKACAQDSRQGVRQLMIRYQKDCEVRKAEAVRIQHLLVEEKQLWQAGYLHIAGMDEAGRGPLAGPVVAAACILPAKFNLPGLNDSKKLSESKRERLFQEIKEQALGYAVGSAESAEIDALNILQATKLAMKRAVENLKIRPHFLLIDALEIPLKIPQKGIIDGDALSASIAAASILAKVSRDHLMDELDTLYPVYGFRKNKGYGTREHLAALRRYGVCPIHRRTFAPVKNQLNIV
ncbi:ribonuclease HII [Desulfitobacterium sp. THU1]|uniref:ribonuclease HII n=1 Tax=Desulfitobacterium sp. THU1 TaxID=3138072 RepID=UPI00311E13D6